MKYFILIIIALLGASSVKAEFTKNLMIDGGASGVNQDAPFMSLDSSGNVYIAWINETSPSYGDIYLSKSTDGGNSFSKGILVHKSGKVNADFQRTANMAIDKSGNIYMTWVENTGQQTDVFFMMSTDGGKSFSEPKIVSDDGQLYSQDFPTITVGTNGYIYIAFVDSRERPMGIGEFNQIYFTRSTDGGQTFLKNVKASFMPDSGGSCECCGVAITASPSGHVYIAFRSNINNIRDIYIARSMDMGLTFDKAICAVETHWNITACPVTGPTIALDKTENLYVTWRRTVRVYYSMLPYGANKCGHEVLLAGEANYPSVGVNSQNCVLITYEASQTSSGLDLLNTFSINGVNTFSAPLKITDETNSSDQQYVRSLIDKNDVKYFTWQDSRLGVKRIYFCKDNSPLKPELPDSAKLVSPSDGLETSGTINFKWSIPANLGAGIYTKYEFHLLKDGKDSVAVVDTTGISMNFDESGSYEWYVKTITTIGVSESEVRNFIIKGATGVKDIVNSRDILSASSYPNPFNSSVNFYYVTSADCFVNANIYDIQGNIVSNLFNGFETSGNHVINWKGCTQNGSALSPGIYLFTIIAANKVENIPVILIK